MSNRLLHTVGSRARQLWPLLAAIIIAQILIIIILLRPSADDAGVIRLDESVALGKCRSETINLLKPEKIDIGQIEQVSNFCYMQVRGENLLGDFNVRRSNYLRQQFQGMVFLWMVVAITLSGVLLAAVQLAVAYKLASVGKSEFNAGGEITLEEKRISLKSSVTGLLILTVSFAFFITYVIWVYPLTEGGNVNLEGPRPSLTQPVLGEGQLGTPP